MPKHVHTPRLCAQRDALSAQVTTCASTLKARTDIIKIKHLLDTKKNKLGIDYEEVRLVDPRRSQPLGWLGAVAGRSQKCRLCACMTLEPWSLLQVDLSLDPHRRPEMLDGSGGLTKLPQLHINGKLLGEVDRKPECASRCQTPLKRAEQGREYYKVLMLPAQAAGSA